MDIHNLLQDLFGSNHIEYFCARKRRRVDVLADSVSIEEKLNKSNAQIVSLLEQLSLTAKENNDLKSKLVEEKRSVNEITDQNVGLRQNLVESQHEINELKSELAGVRESVTYVVNQELKSQLEVSAQKITDLEMQLSQTRMAKSTVDGMFIECTYKIDSIVEYNSDLCEKLGLARQDVNDLNENLKSSKEELTDQSRRNVEILNALDSSNDLRNQLVKDFNKQGLARINGNQHADALEFYIKSIMVEESGQKDLRKIGLFWNRISVCFGDGLQSYDKALHAIEKAIECDPSKAYHFYNRAMWHQKLGNTSSAVADLRKSLELNPGDQLTREKLAEIDEDL
ncbi:hypothetical protein M3Y97_01163700 [Aphelenchoides bicaudatus]|nr:hypothetical protein M3Y97_01163700 [Aphelenchoides bicaudatus]